MPLTADDLRAAALSDLRHPSATGQLHILLPDIPGEPFGGTATPAQRQATAEATGQPVPAFLFPGKATRPHDLRALLRAWAAAQPHPLSPHARQEQALRWLAGPCDRDTTPGYRCWFPEENRTPDAPYLAYRWCEPCTAAYGLGEGPDYTAPPQPPTPGRCTATKTEQVDHTPTVRRCTREDTPQAHADGYHQWMRPGHRVRWLVRPGTDNATGPPGPGGTAHWLTMEEGTSLVSQADTRWELLPPDPAAVWDQGEAAGRANAETERRHGTLPVPPHLYVRNPYRD